MTTPTVVPPIARDKETVLMLVMEEWSRGKKDNNEREKMYLYIYMRQQWRVSYCTLPVRL